MTEEEGEQQCRNVGTVDIGIGHDDHLVVPQLGVIERLGILIGADGDAEGGVHRLDLLILKHSVRHSLLDIKDLTAQRKDCLIPGVTTQLRRTTCRVSLDEEELALLRITAAAVCQLTGETAGEHRALALDHLSCSLGCRTRLSRQDHLVHDGTSLLRVLLEVLRQCITDSRVYDTRDL